MSDENMEQSMSSNRAPTSKDAVGKARMIVGFIAVSALALYGSACVSHGPVNNNPAMPGGNSGFRPPPTATVAVKDIEPSDIIKEDAIDEISTSGMKPAKNAAAYSNVILHKALSRLPKGSIILVDQISPNALNRIDWPVATKRIEKGSKFTHSCVNLETVYENTLPANRSEPDHILGHTATKNIPAGQHILKGDVSTTGKDLPWDQPST